MDFSFLDTPELSDDFFDDTFKEIADNAPNVMFVNDFNNTLGKPVSGLITFDHVNENLLAGKKFPEEPRYNIVNDPVPAQVVFKWAKGFYENRFKDFPNVPIPSPIIPPSRYEVNVGIDALEMKLIGKGFKILHPTQGQRRSYASICVDEIAETYVLTEDAFENEEFMIPGKYKIEQGISENTVFVSQENMTRKTRKRLLGWLAVLEERSGTFKVLEVAEQYYSFGVAVELLNDRVFDIFNKCRLIVREIGPNLQVTLTRVEYESLKSKINVERCWISKMKYYVRYYSMWKRVDTTSLVIGLDFNPYSPYSLEVLKSIEMSSRGIEYERMYKEDAIKGFFKFNRKRYHSDVWFPSVFSDQTPYSRDLMSCDLVTNQYRVERILSLKKKFSLLGVPLLIDPFGVGDKIIKDNSRSMLRYRKLDDMNKRYIPYMTTSYKVSELPIVNIEVVEWKNPIIIEYKNGNRDVYHSIPRRNCLDINDYIRWHKNMKKINDIDDYEFVMYQYRKYFVVECNEYSTTGKVMTKGKVKNRLNKKNEVSKSQYKVWKLREERDKGPFFKCYRVPYAIRRYPHNVESTLIGDLSHMTLEEAIVDIGRIKDLVKDPPWLFEVKGDRSYQVEPFEFYEEE